AAQGSGNRRSRHRDGRRVASSGGAEPMTAEKGNDGVRWQSLKEIYAYYMAHSDRGDGWSGADVVKAPLQQQRFEGRPCERLGGPPEDRLRYEDKVKTLDQSIEKVGRDVWRLVQEEAKSGHWIALGRRHPDAEHELIPPRYWPFLALDI